MLLLLENEYPERFEPQVDRLIIHELLVKAVLDPEVDAQVLRVAECNAQEPHLRVLEGEEF